MEATQNTFISSTFWTERIGSVASLKTLEIMEKFGHFDIILGQRAKDEVFPKILSFLENLDDQ